MTSVEIPVPEVVVADDKAALIDAAGTRLVQTLVTAQRERGSASLVLTGGSNGVAIAEWLRDNAASAADDPLDWARLDLWFGDERFVAGDDDELNHKQLSDALLDHVPVDASRVFVMAPSDGEFGDDIEAAAGQYRQWLSDAGHGAASPAFDVHLLGMGGEGHINSLFPHTPALAERDDTVVSVHDSPKPPPRRITLTVPVVCRSREVWFLVAGEDKAEAAAAGITGGDAGQWPCAAVHGSEATVWFLDSPAASSLDPDAAHPL